MSYNTGTVNADLAQANFRDIEDIHNTRLKVRYCKMAKEGGYKWYQSIGL
jgi:hypothetical protein